MITKIFQHTLNAHTQVFFLILGTSIGAGMITLPLLTQGLSLFDLTTMLGLACCIMYMAALCWIDLSQHYGKESHLTTYVRALVPILEFPTHGAYLTFFWSLLAYYLSTMPTFIEAYFETPSWNNPVVYAAILVLFLEASPVFQGAINQAAVLAMLILLSLILFITSRGSLNFHWNMTSTRAPSFALLSPLMMFYGYHLSIPSFRAYELSVPDLRKICLIAGLCIGLLYWLWCLILLSAVDQSGVILNETQFLIQLGTITHSSQVLHPIAWFSLLAMWTSCLGMSLGTQHYLNDLFPQFRYLPFSLSLLNILPSLILLFCAQGSYRRLLTMASFLALYLLILLPALLLILQDRREKKINWNAIALFGLSVVNIIAVWR